VNKTAPGMMENGKMVPVEQVQRLGLDPVSLVKTVHKIEDLRESPLNIVTAECVMDSSFTQNKFKNQLLKKKKKYVMGVGVYRQLWWDTSRNKKVLRPIRPTFNQIYRPYIGQDLNGKTLLCTRTGGIGDLLFILPNLIYLKEKYPDSKIIFACGPQYHAMVNKWDCIDKVFDLPFPMIEAQKADYHAVFEGVIERCKEAHTVNAYHLFTRWLGLNLPDELLVPRQYADYSLLEKCQDLLDASWKIDKFIILQMRASSPVRTPDPKVWINLINKLTTNGHKIVITDNPHIVKGIDKFIETLDHPGSVFNFAKYSETLDWTIAMTKLASCAVCTDSALVHIAASLDTPVFGLYCPFPADIRLSTYKKTDSIGSDIECSPCFTHGMNVCKNNTDGYPNCYNKIDIDEAVKRIERLLEGE